MSGKTLSQQAYELWPFLQPKVASLLSGATVRRGTLEVGGAAPSPHDLNSAHHSGTLADSQATQFLKTDGSRALTGNLTVSAGVTIDNVDISALAAVTFVTIGNSADVANERALAASGSLLLSDGGAGSSATLSLRTPGALSVNTNNDSSVAAHTHAITSSSNPGAAASLLASDASGYLTLVRSLTTDRFRGPLIDTASGDLTLQPADDLWLDPASNQVLMPSAVMLQASNYASQTTGWRVTYDGQADFRYLFVDEMHAKSFIADLEQALAGGQIISKSVAMVGAAFTAPAASGTATLTVRDLPSAPNMAVFQSGDIVRLRQFTRSGGSLTIADCWGVVTSYADAADGLQTWTFTRSSSDHAGAMTAGTVVPVDSIVLDYGVSGNGYYEVNAIDGAYGANSPYAQVVTWTTHPHSFKTVRVRLGNLYGVTGSTEYGLYAGTGTDDTTDQYLIASDTRFELNNLPLTQRNSGTATVFIKANGESRWGSDITGDNVANTDFAIFPVGRTYNGEALGAGDIVIGDHANGHVFWDASAGQLKFRDSTTTRAYVDTDGKVYWGEGEGLLDDDGIALTMTTNYGSGTGANSKITYYQTPATRTDTIMSLYGGDGYGYVYDASAEPKNRVPGLVIKATGTTSYPTIILENSSGTKTPVWMTSPPWADLDTGNDSCLISSAFLRARSSAGLQIMDDGLNTAIMVNDGGSVQIDDLRIGHSSNRAYQYADGVMRQELDSVALANDGVLTISSRDRGVVFIDNVTDSQLAQFVMTPTSTLVAGSGTYFSTAKDTASKLNVYTESGAIKVQNKRGTSQTIAVMVYR